MTKKNEKHVTLYLDLKVYKELKSHAVENYMSMTKIVQKLVENYLKQLKTTTEEKK